MKIVLVGASGTIGQQVKSLLGGDHEVVTVGRNSGDVKMDITQPNSIQKAFGEIGKFDALINASGFVVFAPLSDLGEEQWNDSLDSKLMGQVNLVKYGLANINDKGSFTLVSGILGDVNIAAGVAAATINGAINSFVESAANELPRGVRLNVVSPTLLEESESTYGPFFPGIQRVPGQKVANAFKRSALGIETGKVYKVY